MLKITKNIYLINLKGLGEGSGNKDVSNELEFDN